MTDYASEEFWKGAPEGATHYFAPFFYRADETRAYVFETTWSPSAYNSRQIGEIGVKKPAAAPPWSGDGLPPVGTECEHKGNAPGNDDWTLVSILAHSKSMGQHVAVFQHGDHISYSSERYFRPIKTPAQIAAEEREAAVLGMLCHDALGASRRGLAEALYDAGYRLTKGDDK